MPLLTTLLALTSAHAFAPSGDTFVGIEPTLVRPQHGETQANSLRSPAWVKFVATDGRDWRARFDEATGTPRWMWGKGIPMATAGMSQGDVLQRVSGFLDRHSDLLGFESGTLSKGTANYNAKFDTWYVEFAPLRDGGVPTYRSAISARIKHGNLILLTVGTAPEAQVVGAWSLSADTAMTRAIAQGPAPTAIHTEKTAVPQLLERRDLAGDQLVRTWMVRTRTQDPPGIWVSFVDAETGELLNVHNEVRFIDGTVSAQHHERTVDGQPLVTDPLSLVTVDGDSDDDVTNDAGEFSVTTSGNYETTLHGDYVFVDDSTGADGFLTDNDADLLWTSASATQAEIDTYVFVTQVRAWGLRVEPSVGIVTDGLGAIVNLNQTCNAFYDGNVNFFAAGGYCNNTGQIADVVYHEWGHGFHGTSIQSGVFDGSLSEGAGDTTAFLQTGDSRIGPYFIVNGDPVRDVEPNHVYPDDLVGEVHEDGLIFAGSMWDTWGILNDDLGAAAGTDAIEQIFAGLLKGGPTIPDSYFEALVADDDDGNLANGTPHQCQIIEGFGQHGLGELTGEGTFFTTHEPLSIEPDGVVTAVDVELQSSAPDCITVVPASGTVHYRVDGGAWQASPASISGQDIAGEIPAQSLGSFVEYYIDGDDTDGNLWQAPFAGEFAPYTFFVGDVLPAISCEDFEASDGGYRHELVSGDAGDGADDWQWGSPAGAGGDPAAAYSGSNVWGNDLGGGNFNGQYQPDKVNRLWSPTIDTLWYTDVFLQYRRWLNVEDGIYDQGVITANGSPVWTNHDSPNGEEFHEDRQWVSHAVDLGGLADQTTVELGWEMHSDPGLEFGGWTIDDVCLYAPATADNRLAIVDFAVADTGGPISLTWTNPIYAPVEQVLVLRKTDAYPTSHEDGEVVAAVNTPTPGSISEKVHGNLDGSSGFYAVYAFDGDEWLSWTIEGWNAGYAAPNEGGTEGTFTGTAPPDPTETNPTGTNPDEVPEDTDGKPAESGGGCACDASPSGTLAIWPILGLLALARRRSSVKTTR